MNAPWRYGALGFPLAFVALPLYVTLPAYYAERFAVPLAALGAVLLAARALDALADPFIGRLADRWLDLPAAALLRRLVAAALLLAVSFSLLFFPPRLEGGSSAWLAWCAALLLPTYAGYSLLMVTHQAWGARLGGDALVQTRLNAWREGLALAGVLCASVLPSLAGMAATSAVLALALLLALPLLARAPRAAILSTEQQQQQQAQAWSLAWRTPGFMRLMLVFLLNGIAAAIPATLLLFFVRDRLQTPALEPLFLLAYFIAAALSLPLWLRLVRRLGAARAWGWGMALAIAAFVWAASLGAGDWAGFVAVCIGSGIALGADLALPGALLTRVIQRAGLAGRAEGAFFGWWSGANKLNLALAAGLALPLLQLLGYAPGSRDAQALQALTLAYCLLPCALKALALLLLHLLCIRPERHEKAVPCPPLTTT